VSGESDMVSVLNYGNASPVLFSVLSMDKNSLAVFC
jgi:hypothetical protein